MNQLIQIQEIVFDYFKDVDNKTLTRIVDAFVFHQAIKPDTDAGKLVEKFLADNELEMAYIDYVYDYVDKKSTVFSRSNSSQTQIIEYIKTAFLTLSYNRFRQIDHLKPTVADKVKVLGTGDIEVSVHVVCNINSDYTICSLMIDGDFIGKTEPTTERVDCNHCLQIVNMCKSIEI